MEIRVFGFIGDIYSREAMRAEIKARVMDSGDRLKALIIDFYRNQPQRILENLSDLNEKGVVVDEFIEVCPMMGDVFDEQSLVTRLSIIGKNMEVIVSPPVNVYIGGRLL